MTRDRGLDLLGTVLRLVLGGVLLVAGALKVTNLGQSALAVRAYQLLPYDLAGYVGYALPVIEIIVQISCAMERTITPLKMTVCWW